MIRRLLPRWPVMTIAAVFVAAHLPSLAPSLEDIDSINFALGLRDFNVAEHRPHPPGYPLYIAMGRLALWLVHAGRPTLDEASAEALALALWSALAGGAAIVAAWSLFGRLRAESRADPVLAVLLLAATPLFWMTALRPMSDMVGLAAALAAQTMLAGPLMTGSAPPSLPRLLGAGLAAGAAAGIRLQTVWLTGPLLVAGSIVSGRRGLRAACAAPAGAALAVLAWAIPLVVSSGGIDAYLQALGSQARASTPVESLWANPSTRRAVFSLYETFVLPWASIPLGIAVLGAAGAGAAAMVLRERRGLAALALAFAPYVLFHLLVQETLTVRYALPVVVPIAWLAVRGLVLAGRLGHVSAIALAAAAALVAVPGAFRYGREPHPAFQAIAEMTQAARQVRPAAVYSHYSLRRPLEAANVAELPVVLPPRTNEWRDLVNYWREGGSAPVWFLADARRTDLALIDPQSRREKRSYVWAVGGRPELGGTRPLNVDWYRFEPPGWFATEGWSLTPELGGLVRAAGTGLDRRPLEVFVRRSRAPMHVMIGGRYLGPPGDPDIAFRLDMRGAAVDAWTYSPRTDGPNFLRFIPFRSLGEGEAAGEGYVRLTLTASPAAGTGPPPEVAIRQFDVQPAGVPMFGFGEGWHEEEYDTVSGRRWRWTSGRSVLRVLYDGDLELELRGESPLKYFDEPPVLRIAAGDRTLGTLRPAADFTWRVRVPAEDLRRAGGAIAVDVDRVYLPGEAEGTSDVRQLGVRLFAIDVHPVSP